MLRIVGLVSGKYGRGDLAFMCKLLNELYHSNEKELFLVTDAIGINKVRDLQLNKNISIFTPKNFPNIVIDLIIEGPIFDFYLLEELLSNVNNNHDKIPLIMISEYGYNIKKSINKFHLEKDIYSRKNIKIIDFKDIFYTGFNEKMHERGILITTPTEKIKEISPTSKIHLIIPNNDQEADFFLQYGVDHKYENEFGEMIFSAKNFLQFHKEYSKISNITQKIILVGNDKKTKLLAFESIKKELVSEGNFDEIIFHDLDENKIDFFHKIRHGSKKYIIFFSENLTQEDFTECLDRSSIVSLTGDQSFTEGILKINLPEYLPHKSESLCNYKEILLTLSQNDTPLIDLINLVFDFYKNESTNKKIAFMLNDLKLKEKFEHIIKLAHYYIKIKFNFSLFINGKIEEILSIDHQELKQDNNLINEFPQFEFSTKDNNDRLISFCENKEICDPSTIDETLSHGVNLSYEDNKRRKPFDIAFLNNNLMMINKILSYAHHKNIPFKFIISPSILKSFIEKSTLNATDADYQDLLSLYTCVINGYINEVKTILNKQENLFDFIVHPKKESLVLLSCAYERFEIVKELLSRGYSINITNNEKWTPFHYAIINNKDSNIFLSILLENGTYFPSDKNDINPIFFAVIKRNFFAANLLLDKICNSNDLLTYHGSATDIENLFKEANIQKPHFEKWLMKKTNFHGRLKRTYHKLSELILFISELLEAFHEDDNIEIQLLRSKLSEKNKVDSHLIRSHLFSHDLLSINSSPKKTGEIGEKLYKKVKFNS